MNKMYPFNFSNGKNKTVFLLAMLAMIVAIFSCNKSDDTIVANNATPDSIIGTWKLVEEYRNDQLVTLNDCGLQENYIFGADQFTHEIYGMSGKTNHANNNDNTLNQKGGDDDDDDSASDDSDDEGDDESDDEGSDEGTDEGTDDDGGNTGGVCALSQTVIGYWLNANGTYTFNANSTTESKTIHFTDAANKFYFEVSETANGTTVTRKYVFQRQ